MSKPARYVLPSLLAIFVSLALAYSVAIPLGEASDEVSHFAYVQYLVKEHALPWTEGPALGEAHQPPLFYLLAALAISWVPQEEFQFIANPDFALNDSQTPNLLLHPGREAFPYQGATLAWHLARVLSIIMAAITVWATWRIGREFMPDDVGIPLAAAAFVGFLPGFLFISAVVNNDNLVIMLSSLAILQTLRVARHPSAVLDTVLLGILIGLAVLAKLSGFLVWPFAVIVIFGAGYEQRDWKVRVLQVGTALAIGSLVLTPWLVYNWQSSGDALRWSNYLAVATIRQDPVTVKAVGLILENLWASFWGSFGGVLQLKMAYAVYACLTIAGLLCLLGWIGYLPGALRRRFAARSDWLFISFSLFWVLLLSSYARWAWTDRAAGQARLLFPGLPLLSIFLTAGLARLFAFKRSLALVLWAGGFFCLSVAALIFLVLTFGSPARDAGQLPALGADGVPADFGHSIRVLDYTVEPRRATPGQAVTVLVNWQAIDNPTEDLWLLLQLGEKQGAIANKDGVPSGGRLTTDRWKKGQVFQSRHTIVVPDDITPGTFELRLGLHPFGRWDWLPVRGQEMLVLDKIAVSGAVENKGR